MTLENKSEPAYGTKLRQSGGTAAGAATLHENSSHSSWVERRTDLAAPFDSFSGVEKRASSRHKCEGTIEMHAVGSESPTWATITDISMHGCYVDTHATYPVGTVIELKLSVNGISVQTKGTVRVNYPYLGMGIAFSDPSPENQNRLREILRTVARLGSPKQSKASASSAPSNSLMGELPRVTDTSSVVDALIEFYRHNHILTREEFLKTLWKNVGKSRS